MLNSNVLCVARKMTLLKTRPSSLVVRHVRFDILVERGGSIFIPKFVASDIHLTKLNRLVYLVDGPVHSDQPARFLLDNPELERLQGHPYILSMGKSQRSI